MPAEPNHISADARAPSSASGVILHHDVAGRGQHPPLLLIHALGGDLHFWDDFRGALGGDIVTIACDLRSAGRSPRPSQPVSLAEHADDLDALRRHLGFETVIPFGCAIGSMAAAAYAAAHPEPTAGLILSNPALSTSPQAGAMLTKRAEQVRRGGMAAILPGAVERAFLEQPRDGRYHAYRERFAAQDPEAYALSCLSAVGADTTSDLRRVRCPALVIAGGHDVLLPQEQARAVHGLIAKSRFELIGEGAHFLPYQQPKALAALVRSFLGANGLGPA